MKAMHFSKAVVRYRIPILIIALVLMVPSLFGMVNTRINYLLHNQSFVRGFTACRYDGLLDLPLA